MPEKSPLLAVLGALCAALLIVAASPAEAKCKKLGFSVNDYGKEGPTNDAKSLLEKYVAEWAKQHNIAKYTIGKKDVSCELYLNLIVVDEHTCKAEAMVCWGDDEQKAPETKPKVEKKAEKKVEKKVEKTKVEKTKVEKTKAKTPPKAEKKDG